MFLVLIAAVFGNVTQLQSKYDHCKTECFRGEYCKVQKYLSEQAPTVKKYNYYMATKE